MKMKKLLKDMFLSYSKFACRFFPYSLGPSLAKLEYRRITGTRLNLVIPKNLIEKIIWMQFHTDTALWTKCADKYEVREYVESKGLGNILPKLYGKWNAADEIDFHSLPDKFVLKTNNSCGQIIIVRNKNKLNIEDAKNRLNRWLRLSYGYHNAQLHYLRIKPLIIAEELLESPQEESDGNLIDYKIFCINGQPQCIMVVTDRTENYHALSMFDKDWNNISEEALNKKSRYYSGKHIPRPEGLEIMLEYAKTLSQDIPHVRVDFYDINGKVYFGEMTFTPGYGTRARDFSEKLGSQIDLTKLKRIR